MLFLLFFAICLRQVLDGKDGNEHKMTDTINVGLYAGVTAGVTIGVFLVAVVLYCIFCRPKTESVEEKGLIPTETPQENKEEQ